MPKLAAGSSANSFKVNELDYIKGTYDYIYHNVEQTNGLPDTDIIKVGIRNFNTGETLVNPAVYTDWVDGADSPFASFSALVTAIGDAIK